LDSAVQTTSLTAAAPSLYQGSPERFGYKWDLHNRMLPVHEEQFRRWTAPLLAEDWRGLAFLDVGCGMGRNSFWPLRDGAARGVAIDVDERSLACARRNLQELGNVQVREISAYEIPYENEFDVSFSLGVIHHLEQPALALANMVKATKPGGKVLIWVYGRENNEWIVRFVDPLRKELLSRLPIRLLDHLSLYPTALLWLALRLGAGRTEYMRLIRRFGFRHLHEIVFDQLLPRTARYWTRAEVTQLMRGAGLEDIELHWVNQISWTATGRKPRPAA
jgi:SAM-dependent methyltransferase